MISVESKTTTTMARYTRTAAVNGGNITVSFPTQTGYSYQLQYKDHLTDANWISLGSPISGNGSVQSGTDTATGGARFYQVQVQ